MVLQSNWRTENCHDPVTGELVNSSAITSHNRGRAFDQLGHYFAKALGAQRSSDVHRPHNVGEQHGHLLVLGGFMRHGDRGTAGIAETSAVPRFGTTRLASG